MTETTTSKTFDSLFRMINSRVANMDLNSPIEIELQFGKIIHQSSQIKINDIVRVQRGTYKVIDIINDKYKLQYRKEPPLPKLYTSSELEKVGKNRFRSGVPLKLFNRLMKELSSKNNPDKSRTEDKIQGDIRVSIDDKTRKETIMKKLREWNSYDNGLQDGIYLANEFNSKINISKEIRLNDIPRDFKPTLSRIKTRYSFPLEGARIDITQVESTDFESGTSYTTYEVEIEINELINNPIEFDKLFRYILRILQGSRIPYSESQKKNVYDNISNLLGLDSNILKRSILTEARDLQLKDMVHGGLIGNKDTPYHVTYKTDGIRKMLAVLPSGMWLLMPGTEELDHITSSYPSVYLNSILDGELVSKDDIRDILNIGPKDDPYIFRFFVFDCLVFNKENIQDITSHIDRLQKGQMISDSINSYMEKEKKLRGGKVYIQTVVKNFMKFFTEEEFYLVMQQMFLFRSNLPYKDDGFVFTPLATVYNPHSEKFKLKDRVLTKIPDILKWKPIEKRTIDLSLNWKQESSGKILYLDSYEDDGTKKKYTRFTGTSKYPLLSTQIDPDHILLRDLPSSTIVEFRWDDNYEKLFPLKIREDKPLPNRLDIAQSVWNGIFDGVTEKTLIGKSFDLMRKYHNNIKNTLFSSINSKYLLDIGSGKGGDLIKWSKFEKIVAVEPNQDHIDELLSRISTSDMQNKVYVVKAGGEDTDIIRKAVENFIPTGKVSCISLMLSMSFFDTKEKRQKLYQTFTDNLIDGGDIIYLTIDGDLVHQTFNPSFSSTYPRDIIQNLPNLHLSLINATLDYNINTKYLTIDIPGTIVTKQIERPPFISELLDEEPRLYNVELHRADKEKFLNFSEKILSNMYSYGKFKLMNTDSKLLEIEEIIETDSFTAVSLIPDYYILLHGILKTISTDYQINNSLSHRLSMVKTLYNELKEISNNPILDIKPLPDSSLNIICNIMNIQVLLNNTIYGSSGQKVIIYNNYMIFTTNIYHLDEIPNIYENNCPPELDSTLSSDTTFSSFLNKAYKYNKRISK